MPGSKSDIQVIRRAVANDTTLSAALRNYLGAQLEPVETQKTKNLAVAVGSGNIENFNAAVKLEFTAVRLRNIVNDIFE